MVCVVMRVCLDCVFRCIALRSLCIFCYLYRVIVGALSAPPVFIISAIAQAASQVAAVTLISALERSGHPHVTHVPSLAQSSGVARILAYVAALQEVRKDAE